MASGFDVLELFVNNPDKCFSVSDVMRDTPICWASAKDYIIDLSSRGWILRNDVGKYSFNKKMVVIRIC